MGEGTDFLKVLHTHISSTSVFSQGAYYTCASSYWKKHPPAQDRLIAEVPVLWSESCSSLGLPAASGGTGTSSITHSWGAPGALPLSTRGLCPEGGAARALQQPQHQRGHCESDIKSACSSALLYTCTYSYCTAIYVHHPYYANSSWKTITHSMQGIKVKGPSSFRMVLVQFQHPPKFCSLPAQEDHCVLGRITGYPRAFKGKVGRCPYQVTTYFQGGP